MKVSWEKETLKLACRRLVILTHETEDKKRVCPKQGEVRTKAF